MRSSHTFPVIIHVDMDAFFASCEQQVNPELRGKAIAVGGSPEGRGVVAAASYEARKFGVRSAMPAAKAKTLCPHLIFVRPNGRRYSEFSRKIHSVFAEVTSLIEPLSLDEAFLDVSTNWLKETDPIRIGRYILRRIKQETGLNASVGIAPTKMVAKIASDIEKPCGFVVVRPEEVLSFLEPLPIRKLWGVGPATAKRLERIGIFKVGDVREFTAIELERELGSYGPYLLRLAKGIDNRKVASSRIRKSVGSENTYAKDLLQLTEIDLKIDELLADVLKYVKRKELSPRTITLKVRYHDFETITRSRTVGRASQEFSFWKRVLLDLQENTELGSRPVRLLGVAFSQFIQDKDFEQLKLDLKDVGSTL